jgi:arginine N-succinyltransferase
MIQDYILRPIRKADFEAIRELTFLSMSGLTTLPKDDHMLREIVTDSLISFKYNEHLKNPKRFFFVLEHVPTQQVVGMSSIFSNVEKKHPLFSYRIDPIIRTSAQVSKITEQHLLTFHSLKNGHSEIGGLYLHPHHRMKSVGRFLSLSRFLFMKMFQEQFSDTVIAEIRGVFNNDGVSPFWEAVGKKLYGMPFSEADKLSMSDRRFIKDLSLGSPICLELLPEDAQAVVGQAHPFTVPALKILLKEGFRLIDHIDVFDGGPKISAHLSQIGSVKRSRFSQLHEVVESLEYDEECMVCHGSMTEFKSVLANVSHNADGSINMKHTDVERLGVKPGAMVCLAPLHEKRKIGEWVLSQLSAHEIERAAIINRGRLPKADSFLRRFGEWYSAAVNTSRVSG